MSLFGRKPALERHPEGAPESADRATKRAQAKAAKMAARHDITGLSRAVALGRHDPALSSAAAVALVGIGDAEAMQAVARHLQFFDNHPAVVPAVEAAQGPAFDWMLAALADPDGYQLKGLAYYEVFKAVIGRRCPDERTVDVIATILTQPDLGSEMRLLGIAALGRLGSERSLQLLRATAAGPYSDVRDAALDALAQRGNSEALALLDGSPEAQALIAELEPDLTGSHLTFDLERIEWERHGTPPSLRLDCSPQAAVRSRGAVQRLVRLGTEAVEPLKRQLDRSTFAYEALGEIGGESALQALLARLQAVDPRQVLAAVQALGRLGDERALAAFSTLETSRRMGDYGSSLCMADIPEIRQALTGARFAITHAPADATAARVCAACGTSVLRTTEFVAAAREAGFVVDPLTGDATYTFSGRLGEAGESAATETQGRYDALEARRAYVCRSCGKLHCTACLMSSPQHPVTKGPCCPSCGEGPHDVLD